MDCERCGRRPASVRWRDPEDTLGEPLWLCPVCAGELAGDDGGGRRAPGRPDRRRPGGAGSGHLPRLRLDRRALPPHQSPGLPQLLHRLPRRCCCPSWAASTATPATWASAPSTGGDEPSRLAEITRTRVALEKAVAREDFEAAAALRDRIRELEARPPEQP